MTDFSALSAREYAELENFCDGPITQQMVDDKLAERTRPAYQRSREEVAREVLFCAAQATIYERLNSPSAKESAADWRMAQAAAEQLLAAMDGHREAAE